MPGDAPDSPAEAARDLLRRGFLPLPLDPKSKGTKRPGWPDFRTSPERVEADFPAAGNIGVLLGEVSGDLTDLDLDCPEALRLAPAFLPPTGLVSGRASAPDSHRFYVSHGAPYLKRRTRSAPETKATLLEIRSGTLSAAHQTMVPPSVHPSGERVSWSRYGDPAAVPAADLERAARELAAASLLLRYLPARDGSTHRHDFFLALSGVLLRGEWNEERAKRFERAIRKAAGDDSNREATVSSTGKRIERGGKATGWPVSRRRPLGNSLGRRGGRAEARGMARRDARSPFRDLERERPGPRRRDRFRANGSRFPRSRNGRSRRTKRLSPASSGTSSARSRLTRRPTGSRSSRTRSSISARRSGGKPRVLVGRPRTGADLFVAVVGRPLTAGRERQRAKSRPSTARPAGPSSTAW